MKSEFINAIRQDTKDQIDGIHTAFPGYITEINYDNGTCSVQPYALMKTVTDARIMYPMLHNVPIVVPQSSVDDACVAYPIKPGDTCLVIISEGTLDYWLYERVTETDSKFDLTNAVCIPGLVRRFNSCFKEAAEDGAVILKYGEGKFKLTNDTMTIQAKNLNLLADNNLTLSAGKSVTVSGDDVDVSGVDVSVVGSGDAVFSGADSTRLSSGGNVQISGSRIDLN